MTRTPHAWLGLAALVLLSLSACSGPEPQASPDAGTPPGTTTTPPDEDMPPAATAARLTFEPIALEGEPEALTDVLWLPGRPELWLLRKDGEVLHYRVEGDEAKRVGAFRVPDVESMHDCGLISVALEPDLSFVYFGHCTAKGQNRISRLDYLPDDREAMVASRVEILTVTHEAAEEYWHNIGAMALDTDGALWALFGENADADAAQDYSSPVGALLKIVPSREPGVGGWQPAPGNPYLDQNGTHPAIYAKGLRSPWRGHLDELGQFWIGDVGGKEVEEVNLVDAPGLNFGWPRAEGECSEGCEALRDPAVSWGREADHPYALDDEATTPTTRRAVWVGPVHRPGARDPYAGRLANRLLFGDFCTGWVRSLDIRDPRDDAMAGHLVGVVGWTQADDGHLYVATYGNCRTFPYRPGALYRAVLTTERESP